MVPSRQNHDQARGIFYPFHLFSNSFSENKAKEIVDEDRDILKSVQNNSQELSKETIDVLKKRKLIEMSVLKYYQVKKGPQFKTTRAKKPTDLTSEMIQSGSWKTTSFKPYNYNSLGKEISVGNLHPLMKVRTQFREIVLEMG